MSHEWIENNSEFEGVLVCTNDLEPYDKEAIVRAFQIYQWDDATTPGNDSSFNHVETGVVIRHDGSIIAIDFGHGRLEEALPDLYSVLHSIGWRTADLHHPAETMNALLAEMGRAIPARLDFEIRPAVVKRDITEFPESAALVARGREILGGGEMDDANSVVLSALQSMDQDAFPPVAPSHRTGAIVLVDGDDDGGGSDEVIVASSASSAEPRTQGFQNEFPSSAAGLDHFDEQPQMFVLPTAEEREHPSAGVSESSASVFAPVDAEVEDRAAPVTETALAPIAEALPFRFEPSPPAAGHALAAPVGTTPYANDDPGATQRVPAPAQGNESPKGMRIGASLVYFSLPTNELSSEAIQQIASEQSMDQRRIVHLYPGALNGSLRWDVLGEVVLAHPWFAERLATLLVDGGSSALVASTIMAVKAQHVKAQLRDVLAFTNVDDEEFVRALALAWPPAQMLFARAAASGDIARSLNETARQLGALILAPEGQAFVDIRTDATAEGEAFEVFTVRELLQSSLSESFIVHVDALDGPFVRLIAELLRTVVEHYAMTNRFSHGVAVAVPSAADVEAAAAAAAAAEAAENAAAEQRQRVLAELKQVGSTMVGLVDQLRESGVEF